MSDLVDFFTALPGHIKQMWADLQNNAQQTGTHLPLPMTKPDVNRPAQPDAQAIADMHQVLVQKSRNNLPKKQFPGQTNDISTMGLSAHALIDKPTPPVPATSIGHELANRPSVTTRPTSAVPSNDGVQAATPMQDKTLIPPARAIAVAERNPSENHLPVAGSGLFSPDNKLPGSPRQVTVQTLYQGRKNVNYASYLPDNSSENLYLNTHILPQLFAYENKDKPVNRPKEQDKGGLTLAGVTQSLYENLKRTVPIFSKYKEKSVTELKDWQKAEIYKETFWKQPQVDKLNAIPGIHQSSPEICL